MYTQSFLCAFEGSRSVSSQNLASNKNNTKKKKKNFTGEGHEKKFDKKCQAVVFFYICEYELKEKKL